MFKYLIVSLMVGSCLVPLALAEASPTPAVVEAADPAPGALAVWHEVLEEDVRAVKDTYADWDEEDEESPADSVERAVDNALQAAHELREAQMAYGEACFRFCADLQGHTPEEIELGLKNYERCVDDCLLEDLRASVRCNMWMDSMSHAVRLRKPGGTVDAGRPTLWTPFHDCACCGPYDFRYVQCAADEFEATVLQLYAKALRVRYGREAVETSFAEPLTRTSMPEESPQYGRMAALGKLFVRQEKAWKAYCEALRGLICPSRVFHGSGAGGFASIMLSDVRENHMRYITFINSAAAMSHCDPTLPDVPAGLTASCSAGRFHFGGIVDEYATLFRNPDLPGSPWCLIFHKDGPCTMDYRYYVIAPCKELDEYVAAHPDGGWCYVYGYMDVEASGKPRRSRPGSRSAAGGDAAPVYQVHTVFHLQAIGPDMFSWDEEDED